MMVKNLSKRLISINIRDTSNKKTGMETWDLMPAGDAVEIPDEVVKDHKYLKYLKKVGDVSYSK